MKATTFIIVETVLITFAFFSAHLNTYNYETYVGKFLHEAKDRKDFFKILFGNLKAEFSSLLPTFLTFTTLIFISFCISCFLAINLNDIGKIVVLALTTLFIIYNLTKLYWYSKFTKISSKIK